MLPNEIGGIVIGSLPLLLGLFIFAKGAGIETTVNRVIQEMRKRRCSDVFIVVVDGDRLQCNLCWC